MKEPSHEQLLLANKMMQKSFDLKTEFNKLCIGKNVQTVCIATLLLTREIKTQYKEYYEKIEGAMDADERARNGAGLLEPAQPRFNPGSAGISQDLENSILESGSPDTH